MEGFEALSRWEYFNEALVVLGALLALVGVFKVLGSSIKLILWVALVAIGAFTASYGMERSAMRVPPSLAERLTDIVGPGKELSEDALRALCIGLEDEAPASRARSD